MIIVIIDGKRYAGDVVRVKTLDDSIEPVIRKCCLGRNYEFTDKEKPADRFRNVMKMKDF